MHQTAIKNFDGVTANHCRLKNRSNGSHFLVDVTNAMGQFSYPLSYKETPLICCTNCIFKCRLNGSFIHNTVNKFGLMMQPLCGILGCHCLHA
jgi:hypothetical protein